jgi:hypothetical protein
MRGDEPTCQSSPEKEPVNQPQLQNHLRPITKQGDNNDCAWELQKIDWRMILMK